MSIEGMKTFIVYTIALLAGILTSVVSIVSPIKDEVSQLMKQPTTTPFFIEETRALSQEESSTMSASFIKEFEVMMSSGGGERR